MLMLRSWSREQDASYKQMVEGKTVGRRFGGYTRSERVEKKFFLLAMAPWGLLMLPDWVGRPRGASWHIWMWLSIAWTVFVIGYMFVALVRTMRASAVRSDLRYDRKGKFLLPPEYKNTQSATGAKRRKKRG
jgi:hypothetical protein